MSDRRDSPSPLGSRFTVRRLLPDGGVADVIGVLIGIDDDRLLLRDRHGVRHSVPRNTVIASRQVPDTPASRRD